MKNIKNLSQRYQKISFHTLYIIGMFSIFLFYDFLYSLYNSNYSLFPLGENARFLIIFSIMISMIRNFNIRMRFILGSIILSLFQYYYFEYFGNYIQPIAFLQFYQHTGEVFESFIPILQKIIIPTMIGVLAYAIFYKFNLYFDRLKGSLKYGSYIFIGIILTQMIQSYFWLQPVDGKIAHTYFRRVYPRVKEHSVSNFLRSWNYFIGGIVPRKLSNNLPEFEQLPEPEIKNENTDLNVILILGETLRSQQMSLFGYDKKTTPKLDSLKRKELIYSKAIFPGGLMTKTSTNVIMNRLPYPGLMSQTAASTNNLFRNAKRNGFKTAFISNQNLSQLNVLDNLISIPNIDFYVPKEHFIKYITPITKLDEDLIQMANYSFKDVGKNFYVFHQRGSHTPYRKQYPPNFKKFDIHYDNTVLYTDYVLNELINFFMKNSQKETHLIFVSDHGELIGEKGKQGHGWFEDEVINVPFIYTNNVDIHKYSKELEAIKSHFDVSNFITYLLGYDVKINFDKRRTIYINGSDLDALAGYMKLEVDSNKIINREIIQ